MNPYEVVYGHAPPVLLPSTPTVHQFRQLTWFFKTSIRFFTSYRTIFTWQEPTWNNGLINTVMSALFKLVIWFFFVYSLTSNPPWNSKGIRSWLQSSMGHIRFFRRLGLLLINWNFPLLLSFTQYFMSLVSKVIGNNIIAQTTLPKLDKEGSIILEPEAILNKCTHWLHSCSITKFLIH